ncbi:Thioredoxin [compost metagenome]
MNKLIACILGFALLLGTEASAQKAPKLVIGDQAPPLKYTKWIKGNPEKELSENKLYVVEFWATWCGPCKAAMPGLTKLAKEYKGKATFIGANVYERPKDGETYASVLPAVTKFVEGNSANMGYEVIMDSDDEYLGNNWLRAAGINGIPSTFVIKNKQIIWIGHPKLLDSLMPSFLNGTYNMNAYKSTYYKPEVGGIAQQLTVATTEIGELFKSKEYNKALIAVNKELGNNHIVKMVLSRMKFQALLRTNEVEAIKQAEIIVKEFPQVVSVLPSDINDVNNLSQNTNAYGAKLLETVILNQKTLYNPMIYQMLGSLYAKANDYNKAVASVQKAIDALKTMTKEQLPAGMTVANSLPDLEKELESYKKSASN